MSAFDSFKHGFLAPARSARLLYATPDLWPLVAAPAMIMGLFLSMAIGTALYSAGPSTLWLMPWIVRWPMLFAVVRAVMTGLLCLFLGTLAYMLGALVALPFNDRLSERVESTCYDLPSPLSVAEALPISFLHSALGVGLWLLLEVLMLPLQAIPGIGSAIDLFLGLALTAFFLGHQLMDGPMSRWRYSFRDKLDLLWENLALVLGLGLAGTLMLGVPVLNLFGLPICVGAGALLYAEINPLAAHRRAQNDPEHPAR